MDAVTVDLEQGLVALLRPLNRPVQDSAREFIVLELYRRGAVSSGKAAQLLDMERFEFVRYASRLGIAFLDMAEDEWAAERTRSQAL